LVVDARTDTHRIVNGFTHIEIIGCGKEALHVLPGFRRQITLQHPEVPTMGSMDRSEYRQGSGIVRRQDKQPVLELIVEVAEI
jgi:hypothetical protein